MGWVVTLAVAWRATKGGAARRSGLCACQQHWLVGLVEVASHRLPAPPTPPSTPVFEYVHGLYSTMHDGAPELADWAVATLLHSLRAHARSSGLVGVMARLLCCDRPPGAQPSMASRCAAPPRAEP